ncbi:hypothetical protein BH11PLA2_BH11PLA2_20290 [soil metagenome]
MKPTTCDATRNLLLAEPNPNKVPTALRPHVDSCTGCREFLVRYSALHADLKSLPMPSSDLKKIEFLDMLENAGPIIKSVPAAPAGFAIPWKLTWSVIAQPLAVTAATVAVGVGLWSVVPSKKATKTEVASHHELLQKFVAHNKTLANAKSDDARTRIETLSNLVDDLQSETARVAIVAQPEDMAALATMFEKVIRDGLEKQAEGMNKFANANRHDTLKAAADKLALTANGITQLARTAPSTSQPAFTRIQNAVLHGIQTLTRIAQGASS